MYDVVIRAERAVTGQGEQPVALGIADGRIAAVGAFDAALKGARVVELAADEVLLPGLVDTHVHVNEPGRVEWEGFATATKAALAGGVTTILDMPLNSVPGTTTTDALEIKRRAAAGQVWVDVGFWGGAVPGNLADLRPLHDAGVFGFKCFLLDSGVAEFPPLDREQFEAAVGEVAAFAGLMIVHAEDPRTIEDAPPARGRRYRDFLASRPRQAENLAVALVIDTARRFRARLHILHLSSAEALPLVAAGRRDGALVSAETCPHYLALVAEDIPDGATQFKCCPPVREAANRESLWQGLSSGTIDCVVSDHSPCTADLKWLDTGDFGQAWGGIASLQLGLPVMWTEARRRGATLVDVVRWMAEGPARLAGLPGKGRLAVGADADLCVLAPEEEFVVDVRRMHHRNPISAYEGRRLTGVVRGTWLRGRQVTTGEEPQGKLLRRGSL